MTAGLAGALGLAVLALGAATGCSSVGYLAQSVQGHLELAAKAKPVSEWLAADGTPPALRERLALAQRIRDFAVRELALPDNRSYRSYAALDRAYAVWNVVAAPELSLKLQTWCFPVVGCAGYRGYFDRADAERFAQGLKAQGLEVAVYGVPAYSTLGYTNFLGGDPLLSTFIHYPEGELARLIFHELAHQVAYARHDTVFNESFATAVERLGVTRWLDDHASPEAREQYARFDQRRREFRALTRATRAELQAVYESDAGDEQKRQRKAAVMARMRAAYERLKAERWDGYAGYDAWFARANNALLAVQGAYDELVPAFERLFERSGGDFERFYAEVRRLAGQPRDERHAALRGP